MEKQRSAVVILSKNPEEDEEELERRIEEGVRVFIKNKCDFIILSGGVETTKGREADIMEKYINNKYKWIENEKIIKEGKSKDTVENVYFLRGILENFNIKRIYIVSSDYHEKRVKICFEELLNEVEKFYTMIKTEKSEDKELMERTAKKIRELKHTKGFN